MHTRSLLTYVCVFGSECAGLDANASGCAYKLWALGCPTLTLTMPSHCVRHCSDNTRPHTHCQGAVSPGGDKQNKPELFAYLSVHTIPVGRTRHSLTISYDLCVFWCTRFPIWCRLVNLISQEDTWNEKKNSGCKFLCANIMKDRPCCCYCTLTSTTSSCPVWDAHKECENFNFFSI